MFFSKLMKKNKQFKIEPISEVKEVPFVADISLYELENVDWSKFGGVLKNKRILPNSYPKKPDVVDVKLSDDGQPMVLLAFKSETSNSIREYLLLQDVAIEAVNGVVGDELNQGLVEAWNELKGEIRDNYLFEAQNKGFKPLGMVSGGNLYDLESEFMKKYQNTKFDGFRYGLSKTIMGDVPAFEALASKDGRYAIGDIVYPFSPKTLEFCILHMTDGQKAEEGSDVEFFEQKCKRLQEVSCLHSDNWNSVIRFGKKIVKDGYETYMKRIFE